MINLSVRLLHAFRALEESGRFTLAAKRCNVTQSAFSQMIGRLEEQVGTRLFDRDTRSVRLTAEGALFSEKVRDILKHIDRAMQEMRDYTNKRHGHMALAMIPSLAGSWAPALLRRYREAYPGISMEIFDTYSERCLQLLRKDRVEFAITAQPGNRSEFLVSPLFGERFYLVCSQRHAPKQSGQVSLRDLRGLPIIHLIHTESIRAISADQMHQLRPMLRAAGVLDTGIEVEHASTLAGLVQQGLGCSVVPHSLTNQFNLNGVLMLPFARAALLRQIFLVRQHWATLTPAASEFIAMMQATLPDGAVAMKHK